MIAPVGHRQHATPEARAARETVDPRHGVLKACVRIGGEIEIVADMRELGVLRV